MSSPGRPSRADDEAAAARWLQRIGEALTTATQPFAGHGTETHPWTHELWVDITANEVLALQGETQRLQGALHAVGVTPVGDSMRGDVETSAELAYKDVREVLTRLVRKIDRRPGRS